MARLKKFIKRMLIGLLLVASVLILVLAFFNWRASSRVEERLRPLREAGKPTALTDLQTPLVLDESNAAKAVEPFRIQLKKFDRYLAKAFKDDLTELEYEEASIAVARRVSQEFPNLNKSLKDASRLPTYQLDLDYSVAPSMLMEQVINPSTTHRTIVRALYGHGLMSLSDNDIDAAIEDAVAVLKWSQHVGDQPMLINYLVSVACYSQGIDLCNRCIGAPNVSAEGQAKLLDSLPSESMLRSEFERTLDTERAFGISSFGSFPGSRLMYMLGELATYLDMYAEFESFVEKPSGLASPSPTHQGMFGGITWQANQQGLVAFRRKETLTRCFQIRAVWKGTERDTADLGLDLETITDPYNGSLMNVKVTDDLITIYSVGENLQDDGGSVTDGTDIGLKFPNVDK